jgi:ribosomal protein L7/L12
VATIKCVKCQTPIAGSGDFCGGCGERVSALASGSVQSLSASEPEDLESVALFEDMAREMASDSWPGWKTELAERGGDLGISQSTFNRVIADLDRTTAQRASISLAVDRIAIESFFVGHICQLRLRIVNEGERGLKSLHLGWATTCCEGVKSVDSRPVGPRRDAVMTVSIKPNTPGQHVFEGILTATDYGRQKSHFSLRAITFQVAEKNGGPQTIINQTTVDFGNVRAADQSGMTIGAMAQSRQDSGRLMMDGDWVVISLSSISADQVANWESRNQIESDPEPIVAESQAVVLESNRVELAGEAVDFDPEPPAGPPDLPDGKYHYAGPSGRSKLSPEEVRHKVRSDPDENHKVWKEGWHEWRTWSQVPELARAIPLSRTVSPTASRVPSVPTGTSDAQPSQTEIEIELLDAGSSHSKLIRILCEHGELSLGDSVMAVNNVPSVIAHVATQEEAWAIIGRVSEVGAQAKIKGPDHVTTPAVANSSVQPVLPRNCSSCGRVNLGKAPRCMFCGTTMAPPSGRSVRRSNGVGVSSTFGVRLKATGTQVIHLMAVLREITGKGTPETRRMLTSLPCLLTSGLTEAEAKQLAAKIVKAGGAVEVIAA